MKWIIKNLGKHADFSVSLSAATDLWFHHSVCICVCSAIRWELSAPISYLKSQRIAACECDITHIMRSLLRFAISISVRKYFSIRVPTTFFGLRTHTTVAIMIEESAVSSNSELKSNSAFILIFEMHRFGAQNSWQKQFSCTTKCLKLSLVHRLVRRRRRRRSNSSSSHSNRTTSLIVVVQRGKKKKERRKVKKVAKTNKSAWHINVMLKLNTRWAMTYTLNMKCDYDRCAHDTNTNKVRNTMQWDTEDATIAGTTAGGLSYNCVYVRMICNFSSCSGLRVSFISNFYSDIIARLPMFHTVDGDGGGGWCVCTFYSLSLHLPSLRHLMFLREQILMCFNRYDVCQCVC